MSMWSVLVCFIALIYTVRSRSIDSDFYSELQIDEIIYTSVAIPRGANEVEIQLWCEESESIKPVIYLKYDGLPTLTDYDWSSPMSALPDALRILDIQPTQSILYIGIHGGKLLNSYYYFASEPQYILVGVDVMIEKCSNSLLNGFYCDSVYDSLPLSLIDVSTTDLDIPINEGVEYALHVPSNVEGVTVTFSLPSIPSELCDLLFSPSTRRRTSPYSPLSGSSEASYLEVVVDVYLDQPEEDENSARHLLLLDYREVCEGAASERGAAVDIPMTLQDMEVRIPYPLGGMWKVAVHLLHSAVNSSSSGSIDETDSRRHLSQHSSGNGLKVSSAPYQSRSELRARPTPSRRTSLVASSTTATDTVGKVDLSSISLPMVVSTRVDSCVDGKTGFYDSLSSSTTAPASLATVNRRRHMEGGDEVDPSTSCISEVHPLRGARTSSVALGYRTYASDEVPLLFQNSSSSSSILSGGGGSGVSLPPPPPPPVDYVLFSADLSDLTQLPEVGGVMQVQLRLVLPHSLLTNSSSSSGSDSRSSDVDTILGAFMDLHYLVSLRIGGRPSDPNEDLPAYHNGTEVARKQQKEGDVQVLEYGYTSVISSSAYVLSSLYAIVQDSTLTSSSSGGGSDKSESDSDPAQDDRTYTAPTRRTSTGLRISTSPDLSLSQDRGEYQFVWTLSKPALPGLNFVDSEGTKQLYLHVTYERDNEYKSLEDDDKLRALFNQLTVSVKVLFLPCSVSSCVHGSCVTHRGDVDASTCFCKFPWGGEKCDQLVMSHWFYSLQVSVLVLSNLSILPGIYLCFLCGLTPLLTALSFASLSSAFYHLCDTDTYCIADLSFQSLQVMDVLFCTACMASMLLFYAPVDRQTHSSLLVLSLALLVTPVANQPTNALNIVCAIAGSLALCVLLWVNHLMVVHRCTVLSLYQCCCGGNSSSNSSNDGSTTVKKRKRQRRRAKYLIVPDTDDLEDKSSHGGSAGIELTSSSSIGDDKEAAAAAMTREESFAGSNVFAINRQQPDVESSFVSVESRYTQNNFRYWELWITNCVLDLPANLYDCRYSLVGLALALSGLGFFVTQTRESYWFMHSMWHVTVMLSSYFLVRGRFDFMNVLEYTDPENPPFLASELDD